MVLFISCIPFYKLLILSYIDVDPIVIQLVNSLKIIINPIFFSLYNKKYFLFNRIIIINIIINLISCIIPLIYNDNLSLKFNSINVELLGLIIAIFSILLTSLTNIINENFKDFYILNNTFILTDLICSILLTPIIILIFYLKNSNLNNLITINNFYNIYYYSSLIGFIYGPYYISITKKYLHLIFINVSIINNIVLLFCIIISCLLKLSVFYYLYIPSIILIFITSFTIIVHSEKLKNISNIQIRSGQVINNSNNIFNLTEIQNVPEIQNEPEIQNYGNTNQV
jgi:hypothetical protein